MKTIYAKTISRLKFRLIDNNYPILTLHPSNFYFRQMPSDTHFSKIVWAELIDRFSAFQTVNSYRARVLKATNRIIFWSCFRLNHYKICDHFWDINDVSFLNSELPCNLDLGKAVDVAGNAGEVASELCKSDHWDKAGRKRSPEM